MSVIETVECTTLVMEGREYPVTVTRRKGLDTYTAPDGRTILADAATFIDYGPQLGVTRNYTLHPETEPTDEERAENRAKLQAVVAKCLTEQGLW